MSTPDPHREEEEAVSEELVDLDPRIIDHPYQSTAWPDICGHEYATGWPCGYSRVEHGDQGERA